MRLTGSRTTAALAAPGMADTILLWINRGLEALWLMVVVLVPLVFFDRNAALSEAVISYVEVPKVALLHTLTGVMALFWLVEWGLQGLTPSGVGVIKIRIQFLPSAWLAGLSSCLRDRPTRWVDLAVGFFLGTTLLSTLLSGSISVSLWGEIPGQDGFAAYTIVAYVLLFGVIVTHLKSESQLWRLMGAIVIMGVLVSGYGMLQYYGYDFLNLLEASGGGEIRVPSTMGNPVFSAATMLLPIPITLVLATITLGKFWRTEQSISEGVRRLRWLLVVALWVLILTVQLLGLAFTFSRGAWLGTAFALLGLLGVLAISTDRWTVGRSSLVLGLSLAFCLTVVQWPSTISLAILALMVIISLAFILIAGHGLRLSSFPGTSSLESSTNRWRSLSRTALVVVVVSGLVAVTAWGVTQFRSSGLGIGETSPEPGASSEITRRFSSIEGQIVSGSFSGRGNIWRDSWQLITQRPWFEFDNLSLPWLRPVIGYGPDLFRYTFLLVSTPASVTAAPPEADNAHNYFIHQTVEQGYLGLLSSLGIFIAPLLVGGVQLFCGRSKLSDIHKLALVGLLAVLAGRFLEQMAGVARVSDLTVFWALLAVFVALPVVMEAPQPEPEATPQSRMARRQRQRGRSSSESTQKSPNLDWRFILRLALIAVLVGAIGAITWVKTINYPIAALVAGQGIKQYQQGNYQATLSLLERASELAPDVPNYYMYRALVYRIYLSNKGSVKEWGCGLQPNGMSYETCLAWAVYRLDSAAVFQRPFYWRSRLALADSAMLLNMDDKAIQLYREVVSLVPDSWPLLNRLAEAYVDAGQPQDALTTIDKSLVFTGNNQASSQAMLIRGLAYQKLGQLENSAEALETSIKFDNSGSSAKKSHAALAEVYASLGKLDLAEEQRQLAQQ